MLEIMRDVGGVEMPEFFGRLMGEDKDELKPVPPPKEENGSAEEPVTNGEAPEAIE